MGHRFVCERCSYTETAHDLGYDGACEAYVSPAPDAEQRLWALVEAEHRQWIQEGGNTNLRLVRLETSDEDEEGGVVAR